MCSIAIALTIGSTLLGAAGQIQQGQAAARAAEYNAKVAEMNATLSDRRAQDAIERGKFEEQRKRVEVAKIKGQQVAAMAANGVDLSFGSPLDTIVDTAVLGEIDALTIRSNAYRESYDHEVDAVNQRAGATIKRMEGQSAKTGSYLAAGGTILGGMSNAWGSYKQGKIGQVA